MAKLLGIDVGTSGCKALLIDETGRTLASSAAEYPLSVPHPMWAEQNPDDWWLGVQSCIQAIGVPNPDAIGLTGQMHGAVFLDSKDEVVRPAILWNDQRTIEECAWITRTAGAKRILRITCNPPLTGFQAPKVVWLRNREPSSFARVRTVLLPKDYIRFKLSGVKATDVSDASGTGVFDVPNRRWSGELMDDLGLDPAWFPACSESHAVTAQTRVASGLRDGIPIVGGGGDQAAAAVGTGAVEPGVVSVSLGTSGVVFASLDSPQYESQGTTHTFCHANGLWHAMAVMLSCGGALRWYRDTIGRASYDELAALASKVGPGCQGLTFLPYLTGERCPHNDPNARAAFVGLTLAHGAAELSRAVFEGLCFGLWDGLDALRSLGVNATRVRVTGGGARSDFWLQTLSDCFGLPCETLESDEGPAMGAAILAGVGIGTYGSVVEGSRATVRSAREVTPREIDYSAARDRYRTAYASLRKRNY